MFEILFLFNDQICLFQALLECQIVILPLIFQHYRSNKIDLYKTTRKKFTRKINRIKRSIWKVSFDYWSCLSLSYFVVTSNPRETFSRQLCTMDRCRWIIPSMRVPTIDQRCFFFLETTSPSFCNRESFQRPIKNKSVGIARP